MIESPVLLKWTAEAIHGCILDALKERFGTVPRDVAKNLRELVDEKKLRKLHILAIQCGDVEAFQKALLSSIR